MLKDIREGPLIGMDETRVQVLKEEERKNTLLSQMWVAKGSRGERPILLFRYSPSRSGKVALEFLSGYRGCVQTDGYKGYNLVEGNSDIEHFGCWAHARRMFEKAGKAGKNTSSAKQMLKLIGDLYRVEKEAVQKGLDHEGVFELRQEKSRPLLQKIRQRLVFTA